ncbi:MAG: tRNA pseudouridine(38-40) synthase TruA [Deltaproteobacteria bacterium]|uniref:tRNA pseudouridine synthase A n=1 Tax=Candidatus Zymogenus saltonus TaxID=2844893 RepID=A0A9D8KCL0_9DELT|nr:tRNA pseudouridine(38-40) synthase TruA [Candidatus Zymogenus saltonus]
MRNVKLTLSYDGTHFYGWQIQSEGRTVQGVVEDCLGVMLKGKVRINGSGRTDTGVHALAQVANFRTSSDIECDGFMRGLNSLLSEDVRITGVDDEVDDFDARRSAVSRRYRYLIYNGKVPSPFLRNYAWHVKKQIDVDAVNEAGAALLESHDFSSFIGGKNETNTSVRDVIDFGAERLNGDFVSIEIEANAFLRHMVRNIVGTLMDVGWGKMGTGEFRDIINARDRGAAGITAPPQGLYLVEVTYP